MRTHTRPFGRAQHATTFRSLAEGVLAQNEIERFLDAAQRLPEPGAAELSEPTTRADVAGAAPRGIL